MPGKRRELSPENSKMEVDETDASPHKELPTKKVKGPAVDVPKKNVEIKIKNNYPSLYRDAVKHQEKKLALFQQVLDEENKYREIFAQDRESKLIADPHLMVIDAHANTDIFHYSKESEEEKKMPRIFETQQQRVPAATTGLCINDQKEFTRNFSIFMEDQLKYLNWDNVFIAGGSVLACLMPIPEGHNKNNRTRRNYYHKVAYKSSDVDLFIYGLDSEEAANKKIEEIYEAVCEAIPNPVLAFRSKNAITLVSQFPYRHIQIVLRLYKSPAEILMGFDVDCCSVGYDGKKVWVLPRAQRALTYRYNTVDMTRRSPSYEMRLAKYSSRGFSVVVPSFDRHRVDPQLFERRFDQLQGLARLLLLEKLETPEARFRYKEQQRLRKIRPQAQNRESFWTQLDPHLGNDEYNRERLEEQGGADASDYSTVFLPWGPGWTAERARKLMYTKDMILNSKWYDVKKKIHTHPCFFGTVSEVIHDCCGHCPPVPDEQFDPDAPYVSGKLTWVTVNPGSQARIGSFHPITEGDWTEAAYINTKAEKLFVAINGQDVKTVKACIQEGVDVDGRDSAGRTPLQLAAYTNSVEAAKILIENGARISTKTYDGRTALHIAAAYGHSEIIKLIVKRGKELGTAEKKDVDMKDKKSKAPKKKKSEDDEEEDEDEDMDEDEEPEEEDEENEENEDDDEEFQGIKGIIEQKKKEKEAQLEALDPNLDDKSKQDILEIDLEDWDNKFTPLHYAIYFGHVDAIEALIEGGAKVDKSVQIRNQNAHHNDDKWTTITPISLALGSADYKAVIRLLVENGCSIDQVDNKLENVLHKAVRAKHMAAIKFLVEGKFKLNVNAFNKSMETPLHLAIQVGDISVDTELDEDETEEGKKKKEERRKSGDYISDKDFEIIKYLITKGKATVQFTEDDLPDQSAIQQQYTNFSSGGSKREQLRTNITQPIATAAATGSIRLLELLLDEGADVNWFDNSLNTALDVVQYKLTELEGETQDNENLKALEARLKKVKKTSWEYEELSACKAKMESDAEESLNWRYSHFTPSQKKIYAERKKELKTILTKTQAFLVKKKAQPFHAVKLVTKDKAYAPQQKERKQQNTYNKAHHRRSNYDDDSKSDFSMKFKAVKEEQENYNYYGYDNGFKYSDEENEKYLEFFEAIWNGDLSTVEKLAVKPKVGSQVHACSQSKYTGRTPLHIAVERKHTDIAKRLIEIAIAQYTPIPAPTKLDRDGAPAINNYELSKLMSDIRPGLFLDPKGMTLNQQYKPTDPNAPIIQLNSITSPSALLKHADKTGRTIFHLIGLSDDAKLGEEIIETIKSKKVKLTSTPAEEQKMFQQDVDKDLIKHLITLNSTITESYSGTRRRRYRRGKGTHSGEFTPLQVAIAAGSTKVAQLFIEHGGLAVKGSSGTVGEEEMYEGLNVGGKKSDWVLQHRANQNKPKKYVTLLHFAAAVGNEKSINFLVNDAEKLVKQDKKPEDLDLLATDEEERTPLHYAVHHNSEDGVKAILAAAKKQGILEKVVNAGTKRNVTPLHYAASLGYLNMVKLLVDSGADINAKEKTTFFTPLFVSIDHPEVVKYLLAKLDKKEVNAGSKKYNHTPLMYAAYKGFDKTVQLLLEQDSVDSSLRDICGNTALYIAIISEQSKCVELLLNDKNDKSILSKENGIGYIPLDASMLRSLRDDPLIPSQEDTQKIRDLVVQAGKTRQLAKNEDILELTNIMIEQANKFSKREKRQQQHESALCDVEGIKKPEEEEAEEKEKAQETDDGSGMYVDNVSVTDGDLPLQLGIFTRSHDDDMEVDDEKQSEDEEEEEEEKPKKKTTAKKSAKKEESEDEEEEEEEEKPKKKAAPAKKAPVKKSTKKEESEDEEEEEEEEKPKKKAAPAKKAPVKKAAKKEESEDEEEEEKPKKKAAPAKKAPVKKAAKKDESEDEEEEEEEEKPKKKTTAKKSAKKEESDEEEEEEDEDESLEGKVIALTGTLSMKRDDIIKLIKKNGGEYASSITKKVTHLVAADPDSGSGKLEKARKDGIKVVGESFLEKFL